MIKIANPILPDKELIKSAIDSIWETNGLSNFGKYCKMFENKVKDFTEAKHVLAVTSGDTALKLCMSAMKMGNSKVAMPTFTFNSTYMAAKWNNCDVTLMDINPETMLVDLDTIEELATSEQIRNFVLVNVFGNLYNVDELNYLKSKYDLNILFDSAHSFGSSLNGTKSGNFGYTECFSFSPTKLITSAEGGIICTDDTSLYEELRYRRNYGFIGDYNSQFRGLNGKISEINAAIGAYSIDLFDDIHQRKLEVVDKIKQQLWGFVRFQTITENVTSTFKDFVILDVDPVHLQHALKIRDIESKRYFLPLHRQTYSHAPAELFPNAEDVYESSICIPAHANLTDEDIKTVTSIIQLSTAVK